MKREALRREERRGAVKDVDGLRVYLQDIP